MIECLEPLVVSPEAEKASIDAYATSWARGLGLLTSDLGRPAGPGSGWGGCWGSPRAWTCRGSPGWPVASSRELWGRSWPDRRRGLVGRVRGRLLRLRARPRAGPRAGGQGHRGAGGRDPLFVFGGVARIAGELHDAAGEALVAMAGPLASVILAGLFALAGWTVPGPPATCWPCCSWATRWWPPSTSCPGSPWTAGGWPGASGGLTGRRLLATRVTAVLGRALAAVLVLGGTGAALWQWTLRWLPQVVLGLFLWRRRRRRALARCARNCSPGGPSAGSLMSMLVTARLRPPDRRRGGRRPPRQRPAGPPGGAPRGGPGDPRRRPADQPGRAPRRRPGRGPVRHLREFEDGHALQSAAAAPP